MSAGLEIQLIAVFIAMACAVTGIFLVLRHMAMMADAITHTILLGIVLAFFVTHDLSSPWLMVGATAMGVTTVWLCQWFTDTHLMGEDAAMGVVFPMLFAMAIVLITCYAGDVHLDTDAVLLGELAFAPFDRLVVFGADIGARAIYTSGGIFLVSVVVVAALYKELQLSTFDPVLAGLLGFCPVIIHYGLMTLVSLTAVAAFEAVGSVLVVAFMVGPAATASLLSYSLRKILMLAPAIGAVNALLGYQLACVWDVSIAGSMAVVTGGSFFVVLALTRKKGGASLSMSLR
ncbi:metal ABC transporter permease [Bengtsoniella intestinalis]|uniref:metal ABC transporter permease n=1 Tax=Bengtsoniella intestinalis TaxID=3073143 RepID=UPI00391EF132